MYRSGRIEKKEDVDQLKQLGIKTILSLDDYGDVEGLVNSERDWATQDNIEFIWSPMSGVDKPTLEQIYKMLDIITNTSKQLVLIHCKRGSDRTGIMIASYRIKFDRWTVADAKKELRSYGHKIVLYWWDDILDEIR